MWGFQEKFWCLSFHSILTVKNVRIFSCSTSSKANFFQVSIYFHALVFLPEQLLARRMKEKTNTYSKKFDFRVSIFFFFQLPSYSDSLRGTSPLDSLYSEKRAELAQARKRDYEKNTTVEKFSETDKLIAAQARKRESEKNTYVEKYNDIDALIHQLENEGLAD